MPISRTNAAVNMLNNAPGVNGGSAYGGGAGSANALLLDGVDTRDPEGGTAWTFFNYNIIDEVAGRRPRPAGGVRRLHGRGRQHHHQVGRQRASRACSSIATRTRTCAATTSATTVKRENPTLLAGGVDKLQRLHRAARRPDHPRQGVLLRQHPALLHQGGSGRAAHHPHRGQPALQRQAHVPADAERHPHRSTCQYDQYNQTGRTGFLATADGTTDALQRRAGLARVHLERPVPQGDRRLVVLRGEVHRLLGLLRPRSRRPRCRRA